MVLVFLVGLVAGCFPRAADIKNLPEASLAYPGSTLVNSGGSDGTLMSGGANWGANFEVAAPWTAIEAYFHDKLVALGYTQQPSGLIGGDPADRYIKGAVVIEVSYSPGSSQQPGITRYGFDIGQN